MTSCEPSGSWARAPLARWNPGLREKLIHRITPSFDQGPVAAGLRVSFHLAHTRAIQPKCAKSPGKCATRAFEARSSAPAIVCTYGQLAHTGQARQQAVVRSGRQRGIDDISWLTTYGLMFAFGRAHDCPPEGDRTRGWVQYDAGGRRIGVPRHPRVVIP